MRRKSRAILTIGFLLSFITQASGNEAPEAGPDSFVTHMNTPVSGVDVLANDYDSDGDPITVIWFSLPNNGNSVLNEDGTFTYTPQEGYVGTDWFSYEISDGELSDMGLVTITVTNSLPVAVNDIATTCQGIAVIIDVLVNDFDPDGDSYVATLVSGPLNGTLTQNPNGTFTYTPAEDFSGQDGFIYSVTDGQVDEFGLPVFATATVTITVTSGEDFFDDFDYEKNYDDYPPQEEHPFLVKWTDEGLEWGEDGGYAAYFTCETVDNTNRRVMHLKASPGANGGLTSRVTTKKKFCPKGTFAAYVQFNDSNPSEIFEDVSDQDFLAINRDGWGTPCYCEVDFEYLTSSYWGGAPETDILQLNSWDTKKDEKDNADHHQCHSKIGICLDGQWVLLLFQIKEDGNLKFFLHNEPSLPYPESLESRFKPDSPMQIEFSNWFAEPYSGATERLYTMKVDWVYYTTDILDPDEVRDRVNELREPPCNPELLIKATCPIDLSVTDPDGFQISKNINDISNALYVESDINGDGDPDDVVSIANRSIGDYLIQVIPEPDALPGDTYSLEVTIDGQTVVLAKDVAIEDIPAHPYIIRSTEDEIVPIVPVTVDFNPKTLNPLSQSGWVTVYIELPVGHGYEIKQIDITSLMLNGQVVAETHPAEIGDYDVDGIPDLMVKFNRQEVADMLVPGVHMVQLTGQLSDWTLFAGNDTVRVLDSKSDEAAETEFEWIMPEEFIAIMGENLQTTADGSVDAFDVEEATAFMLFEASGIINELSPESFNNEESAFELACALDDVFTMLDEGMYFEVMVILEDDVLERMNGCANIGEPDEDDWITSIEGQVLLYPLVTETIELLESLL